VIAAGFAGVRDGRCSSAASGAFQGRKPGFGTGLFTGSGALIHGTGDTSTGAVSLTVPGLVTLTSPERINVACSHDHNLPAGQLAAVNGAVVAEQVTSRF
jgi:hypothetical protein